MMNDGEEEPKPQVKQVNREQTQKQSIPQQPQPQVQAQPKQSQQRPQQQQQQQQPQQPQQSQQQQIRQQESQPAMQLYQIEQQYTKPSQFKSFLLLRYEINSIENGCMKQPVVMNNEKNKEFYQKLVHALNNQMTLLLEFVEQGKLKDNMYDKFLLESFKCQKDLLDQAKQHKDGLFVKRISVRMNILQDELKKYKTNPKQAFLYIIKTVNPNVAIPEADVQVNKQDRRQQIKSQLDDQYKLSDFKANMNADKMVSANIDNQPKHIKYETLLKRYKQYYNLVLYISTHQKVQKKEQLEQLFQLMEKGKKLREDFTQGNNPSLGHFLINEFKDITFEMFHQKTAQEYKKCLSEMFTAVLEANNKERDFFRITLHSKPVLTRGQTKVQSPSESSKQRQQAYEETLVYLKTLQNLAWVPLPELINEDVQVQLYIENKEIPANVLRVKLLKLGNCKFEKYFISYVLQAGVNVISNQTNVCDQSCVFNYAIDIPITSGQDLANKVVEIRLFEKGFFSNTELGMGTFNFEGVKTKHTLEGETLIKTKKGDITLTYGLYLREPLDKYNNLHINFLKIDKQYPAFDQNEGIKEFLDKFMVQLPSYEEYKQQQALIAKQEEAKNAALQAEKEAQIQEQQAQEEIKAQQSNLILLNHMDTSNEIKAIREFINNNPAFPVGLTAEDLLYPENPAKFPVFNLIDPYTDFLNSKSIELRQEPSLRPWSRFVQKMWEDFTRQKITIEKKLEQQQIDWYLTKVKNLIPLENSLIEIYKSLNLQDWVKFVEFRKKILTEELKELSEME